MNKPKQYTLIVTEDQASLMMASINSYPAPLAQMMPLFHGLHTQLLEQNHPMSLLTEATKAPAPVL